jgi:hypothetical protein
LIDVEESLDSLSIEQEDGKNTLRRGTEDG